MLKNERGMLKSNCVLVVSRLTIDVNVILRDR
jgi:hypothetical protein